MRKVWKLTALKIIRHVTQAISKYLVDKYIVLPTNENDIEEMASNFYNSHGFPQCFSAPDGTRLGVKRSSLIASDFINRKLNYTLNI